ncbi:MAG: choice-of-anchor D domain-containing protein, partial [Melioribacteraceae bacterium]|nr:choice-of-anchor D domain-containing protein [Melioribacteraceae bacterium]
EKSFRLIVGVALTSPTISSDVDSLAFGSVKINANKTLNVTVQNSGDSTLTVSGLTFSNSVFSTTLGTPFSITTGNTQVIPVKFAPTSAIAYLDSLTISSNDPNTPSYQVMLTGTGLELVPVVSTDVTSLDFGSIKVDYDTTLSFKVYNTGDITLNVSGITFTHSDFMLNESASFSVAVGNSVERTVTFSPNTVMNYTDSLTIASDDPVNSEIVIELLADGLAAEESYDFTAGWNLMALPLVPDNFAASEIIGDDAASYFLYSYSSSGGYQNVNTFEMGKGYWLGLESDAAIDMIGTPKIDSTIVPLNNGWNIVGDPYVRDYPTSALQIVKNNVAYNITTAVDSGWVQNAFYSYNAAGGTYESATLFDQWKGYWFAALSADLSLLFHHDSTTGTPLKIAPGMIEADLQNWAVNIKASRDGFTDELLAFGVKSDASDGFDSGYDMAKPPISPSANAIETYFPHNDWTNIISKFAADIKEPFQSPEIKSWTFNLYSKQDGEITLSWENILEQLPAEIDDVILQGEVVTNGEISMTEKLNLTFNASAGTTYEFLISSIAVGIQDKESIPLEFKLEQNYPNPFNPATTINYQIPEDGFVSLKLYNILGAEIATLINEFQTAGYYQHTFNSASLDAGLSSGVYLYEIKVGQHSSIKKMVLLR